MFLNARRWLADILYPEYRELDTRIEALEGESVKIEETVRQRIASVLLKIDPMEMVMREHNGIFSDVYEHPEDRLNSQGKLAMMMWAYGIVEDPSYKYFREYIMNAQGNQTMRAPIANASDNIIAKQLLFGRAQIASMIFFHKEVSRLASLYQEILERNKGNGEFNSETPVE